MSLEPEIEKEARWRKLYFSTLVLVGYHAL